MSAPSRVGGRYEILRKIDEGGMGVVYEARHLLSKQRVALKLLHAHVARDDVSRERFLREVSAPAEIGHPGICQVFDAGFDDTNGAPFVALELLEGESLRKRLDRGIAPNEALDFVDHLLEALGAAHARGFVHRDLKPENVFIARQPNGTEQVKLLDFGIARQMTEASEVTRTGTAIGTPHYMSPEQSMDTKNVRAPTDVWAVGVMLYEVLSGRRPFDGDTPNAVVVHVCMSAHPPLLAVRADVPQPLAMLVERCLSKDIAARPRDASELQRELRAARAQVPRAAPNMPRTMLMADAPSWAGQASPAAAPALHTPPTQLLTPSGSAYGASGHSPQGHSPQGHSPQLYASPPMGMATPHGAPSPYGHAQGYAPSMQGGYAQPPEQRSSNMLFVALAVIVALVMVAGIGIGAFAYFSDDDPDRDADNQGVVDPIVPVPDPIPVALVYVIRVDTQPAGASVTTPGHALQAPGEITLSAPASGPVTLTATLSGYVQRSVDVAPTDFTRIEDRMLANVTIMMQPEPVRAEPVRVDPVRVDPVRVDPVRPEPQSGELSQAEATRLITRYYNSRGEWAGQYELSRVERMRMVRQGADRVDAHTRYLYRCVRAGRCTGSAQVGTDQRVFTLQRSSRGWAVTRMGGHMSASL